jgi:Family of unknown function (DUF5343)
VINKSGAPTEYWTALRSSDKGKFADAVQRTYADLFATYPDADKQDAATLKTFFQTHTALGEKAQNFWLSSRFGGDSSVRERDLYAGAAEVDHRDQRVGGVESVCAV